MYSLGTLQARNVEVTIKGIIERAKLLKDVGLTRAEVLEELKFTDDEDTSMWAAMVDQMLEVQS